MYWLAYLFYIVCVLCGAGLIIFEDVVWGRTGLVILVGIILVVIGYVGMVRLFLASVRSTHEALQNPLHRGLIQHE